jgi:hypothetical protein
VPLPGGQVRFLNDALMVCLRCSGSVGAVPAPRVGFLGEVGPFDQKHQLKICGAQLVALLGGSGRAFGILVIFWRNRSPAGAFE